MKAPYKMMTLVVLCLPLYGFNFYSKLKNEEGNSHYRKGRLGKARSAYEKALKSEPRSNEIAFNLGNTYYKEGSFAESLKNFKSAADKASSPDLQAHAFYNSGNALYRQEDLNKAGEFYKQALRIDPADQDAKYNLEVVERALDKKKDEPKDKDKKDQQKKENKDQSQKDQNKDQDQKQEPKDGKEKEPRSEPGQKDQGQDEPKEGDQKKDPDQKEGGSGQGQENKDSEGEGDNESKGGQQPSEKEESFGEAQDQKKPKSDADARAEQILSALESGEQQAMKMQGSQNGPGPKVRRITEKDW